MLHRRLRRYRVSTKKVKRKRKTRRPRVGTKKVLIVNHSTPINIVITKGS